MSTAGDADEGEVADVKPLSPSESIGLLYSPHALVCPASVLPKGREEWSERAACMRGKQEPPVSA